MGLFGWLFGRETTDQRIARAREALADDEPERALKILVGVDGAEARELVERARRRGTRRERRVRPAADDEAARDEPQSDDDGRERRTDGLEVARALVAALAADPGVVEQPTYPFVDAALLLARAGEPMPAAASPPRARIIELCVAAAAGDHAKVIALAGDRTDLAVALVLRHAPALLAPIAPDDLAVLRAIAAVDRARAAEMLAAMALEGPALGEATLAAIDCGLDHAALHARWPSLAEMSPAWRALEVRRRARTDLDGALALEAEVPDADAAHAVAARLAAVDLPRAIAVAGARLESVGWLRGCTGARTAAPAAAVAGALVDRWLDRLAPEVPDPYGCFRACVAASLRLGDPVRVRRACERGGPTGWQIAHAARWDLARAPDPDALLAALFARTTPGFVSAAIGKVVIRPRWLRLTEPHPIETLAIVAALGPHLPAWFPVAVP